VGNLTSGDGRNKQRNVSGRTHYLQKRGILFVHRKGAALTKTVTFGPLLYSTRITRFWRLHLHDGCDRCWQSTSKSHNNEGSGELNTIKDTIAYAETEVPLCVLSIDLKNAFHKFVQQYLFRTLRRHGVSDLFVNGIKNMYEGASSSLQINGHSYGCIPIQCAVRQVSPMSMVLYALSLHPLLTFL
jgi:hypothetical protein